MDTLNKPPALHGGKGEFTGCLDLSELSFVSFMHVLKVWHERTDQRRRLSELDDRMLTDIGLSREQARQESLKPFWQE